MRVASTTPSRIGDSEAPESAAATADHSTSRSAHQSSNTDTTSPSAAGHQRRPFGVVLIGGFHGEWHEVAQLLQQILY